LRNIDAAELLHFSFAFFLLVKQLIFAGHVHRIVFLSRLCDKAEW
jgi:hypothetical protein